MSDALAAAKAEYDIPDSALEPDEPQVAQQVPQKEPEQPPAEQPKDDVRPRNPDGTFAAAQKPAHSKRVLAVARELGMSDADIEDADPDFLRDEVLTRLASRKQEAAQAPEPIHETPFDLGLTEEDTTPEILGALKKMQAHFQSELAKRDAKLSEYDQRDARRENETAVQQVDRLLEGFDAAHYGKGPLQSLKASSPELGRRQAVVNEAKRLAGANATRQQIIDRLEAAHQSLFGGKTGPKEDSPDLAKKKDDWAKGGLARPTDRNGKPLPKGRAAAIKALQDHYAERRSGEETEEDGIPE